jgi:hypothetical protein
MPALNLQNRGPWNVGGRTRAFGIDVSNQSRLLAGSASGGMWLSENGGTSWSMTTTNTQLKNVTCLVQDKRAGFTQTWYHGSGEAYGASASKGTNGYFLGDGVFKSTDGGETWSQLSTTASGVASTFSTGWQLVWQLAMDVSAPATEEEIYAAIYGTIQRSTDGGTTWAAVRSGGSYFTDVNVSETGVVYATMSDDGSQKGIWRAADGITYANITPSGFPTAYNRIVSGIDPNNENTVYFLANTPGFGKVTYNYLGDPEWNSFWKYTYLSGDGTGAGGIWEDLSMNLPNTGGQFDRWQTQGSYDMVVRVKPGASNVVFIGGTNLYRSTTAFSDSTNTTFIGGYEEFSVMPVINSYANHHPDQHVIEFLPSDPDVMFSANDGGVFRTDDNTAGAVSWTSLNNGYLTTMFYTVAIDHATPNNNIIIAGAQDNGTWYTNSANPMDPWVQPRGGDGSFCAIADNQTNYYFSIQNAKMMKATLDANGNKTGFARIDPIGLENPEFINPFVLDPNNNNIMYMAGGKYLWRNSDLSAIPLAGNWDSISTNWVKFNDSVPAIGATVTAVTACKTPANTVYYGTSKKNIFRVDNAHTGMPTPVDITSSTTGAIFSSAGFVSCIAADPTDGNKIVVVFSNYGVYSMFNSNDGGSTWSKCAGNLEATSSGSGNGPSIRWLSILPVADGKVYLAATSTGFYATDSLNGTSTVWVQQGTSTIGNSVCNMIETRESDGLVVIATHSNGIFTANITSVNDIVTIKDIESASAGTEVLLYPNPAADQAMVRFQPGKDGRVIVTVYDELGREVMNVADKFMRAEKQEISIDLSRLKSGIYYCAILSEGTRRTTKLVVSK